MLAASTTGALIVGIVILLVVLGLLYLGVRLLWRGVTWPFRALRRKPPTGAGADYEAMIRQQRRSAPADYQRPRPFPPHPDREQSADPPYWPPPSGWLAPSSTVEPVPSQVVLPPPPYRTREPEPSEPEPPAVMPDSSQPEPSMWTRLIRMTVRIPPWVTMSFAWLGAFFLIGKPLGVADWVGYGVALVFAVGVALYTRAHYHSKILWRGERQGVVWVRWGKADDAAQPPVVVTPVDEGLPAATEPPPAAPVATQ